MRVLLLCDWFLKVVEGQAQGLLENGAEVALGYRDHAREYGSDPSEHSAALRRLRSSGVELLPLSGPRRDLRTLLGFARAACAWRPDVVNAHANYDPRLLATAAAVRRPLAYTVHDPVPHPGAVPRSRFERATNAGWLRAADTVVLHGESLTADLGLPAARRVRVVPHGIRVALEPFEAPAQPRLLLFGRIEPYKGVDVLLAAMEDVWATRPDVTVTIRGSGSLDVVAPNDARVVIDQSYVPESEIDPMFAGATLTVLPYRQGSQTGVGIQSVARGVPVVVTDVGALPDVADGTGEVVAPGDPAALAAGILRMLGHDQTLRARVHRHAVEHFDWTVVARRYLDVYTEATATGAGSRR
jgi:glycosyltransferase involved in cell wall biosynthesis